MLKDLLKQAETIAIGGHIRPDGDCVGACMGLYHYIRENFADKETAVYLEDVPESFRCVKGIEDIRHEAEGERAYDLFICLDCGAPDRLGFSVPLFEQARDTFCVDHHVSNVKFARENYIIPDASSTSELVYDLMDKDKISLTAAEALYLGIVHDTGVFRYSCTAPSTLRMAADLLERGVDAPNLIRDTFYVKTYAQNQILGRALMESILFLGGTCIVSYLRKYTMEFYGITPKELDGIVSHLRDTEGIKVAVFMYELETNMYKVSLRSNDEIDVSTIARYYGGGGHKKAAGFTMAGNFYDIINSISAQIELQLKETL